MPPRTVAIVGASTDRRKFGNKSLRAHAACGWDVLPVHPSAKQVEGHAAVARLSDLPGPVDRVSLYVPSDIGLTLVPAMVKLGAAEVWVNPGAGSPELVEALQDCGLTVVEGCSIVDLGVSPSDFP